MPIPPQPIILHARGRDCRRRDVPRPPGSAKRCYPKFPSSCSPDAQSPPDNLQPDKIIIGGGGSGSGIQPVYGLQGVGNRMKLLPFSHLSCPHCSVCVVVVGLGWASLSRPRSRLSVFQRWRRLPSRASRGKTR
jgi:hypothetical protein